ncbi:hypothetical protein EJ02DRAFT_423389 [Clathrospora elynae]|uniref:Uncharacterized protein n=1 Tax=Clathrospora elynae TaxID=706981 RepID=A0A6A5SR19_9PLEO|nr:hypothetical protein EJ02DRAFT_423389 [Clathrospora elynae]
MPKNKHLKGVIFKAVGYAERLIYTYPNRFYDIEEAKSYINSICEKGDFNYSAKMNLTDEDFDYVKDKVHFVVAVRAFEQGEFYLDIPMPDTTLLRAAIESDITRVLQLIPSWPDSFLSVPDAQNYVAKICHLNSFNYTEFEGVEPYKFGSYVNFNTARHAYEAGRFEMHWPGKGWSRKPARAKKPASPGQVQVVEKKFGSLHTTIEADIKRLTPLIFAWPASFPSLNDARNFVQRFCNDVRFRYTGWLGVDLQRFKLFVHFNTAKLAHWAGKFTIQGPDTVGMSKAEAVVTRKADAAVRLIEAIAKTRGKKTSEKEEDSEDTLTELDNEHVEVMGVDELTKHLKDSPATSTANTAVMVNNISPRSTASAMQVLNSFQQVEESLEELEKKVELVESAPVAKEDPFKDLIAELGRAFILKAAFE